MLAIAYLSGAKIVKQIVKQKESPRVQTGHSALPLPRGSGAALHSSGLMQGAGSHPAAGQRPGGEPGREDAPGMLVI